MKTTAGWRNAATPKSVRTSFSPSPIHLLVRDDELIEKKVAPLSWAIALPISVFLYMRRGTNNM
jgi:hypothetical protein